MSDSDVESDIDEGPEEIPHTTSRVYLKKVSPPVNSFDVFEQWKQIPVSVKKKSGHLMHMGVFWWNILLRQQDKTSVTHWAVQVGFLDGYVTSDLSLKRLFKIEILESLFRALEKGCLSDELTRHLVSLGTRFDMCPSSQQADCMVGAMRWLEMTGEPGIQLQVQRLGNPKIRYLTLSYLFTEYAHYVHAMAYDKEDTIERLITANCKCCVKKSEEMKNKGNDLFRRKKYDAAVKYYTKAIRYHPDNHFLYGNRALCFINSEKYQKAIGDGKRATVIKPDWAKGHYQFCQALFALGEHRPALAANERALGLCDADAGGVRDLQQQRDRFLKEIQEGRGGATRKKGGARKDLSKRVDSVPRMDVESPLLTDPSSRTVHTRASSAPESKEPEDRSRPANCPGTAEGATRTERNSKEPKQMKSEMPGKKTRKTEASTPEKPRTTVKHPPPQEKRGVSTDGGDLRSKLKSAVEDAHTALYDQRCRNAEQAFSQALCLLDSTTPKALGITERDVVVLKYGHATALLETGQPDELIQAKEEFDKIQKIADRSFQCLVFFGIGKACLKENRFSAALEEFSNCLRMINLQITPGKLTWPTTKVIVEETQTENFKDLLEKFMEMCKLPPKPDAVCRHANCQGHSKPQIYFTDPDFKGFIRMICCQKCNVEFHISCWKKMKAAVFCDKNDKDFLQEICFTPDCGGKICHIVIFGLTGLMKCEFESAIKKITVTAKPRVKQICTSLKKLKSKEDRKIRRKHNRQKASQARNEQSEWVPLEKSAMSRVELQENASQSWLVFGDRVLHQIFENKELLKEDTHNISDFMKCIHPWRAREKGNDSSVQCLMEPGTMGDIVDLLLEQKNRVWARIFIQYLSDLDISPKLHSWARGLDSAGLQAAETFIERYAKHLEELDLAPLLHFGPLQDTFIQKFGTVLEIFSDGFTVTDYLKQAPPHEMRLFIWTLEEHRDLYAPFQHALNEYFEIMDGLCLIIKKTEHENQINSPVRSKNKSRKKKQKEPKQSVIVLSGSRGGALREEDDEDVLSEEDSLMLLDPSDPFMVPERLRNQVAEFEGRYNNIVPGSHYRRILDNNPDTIKESLYDYFEQILEAHGPMETDDQLLVGELENFPTEAQLKIHEAGGLQPFLLESLRFVMNDNLMGLMKHAVSLQEVTDDFQHLFISPEDALASRATSLNPSAKEFQPLFPLQDNGDASASFGDAKPFNKKAPAGLAQQDRLRLASSPLFEMPDPYSACLDLSLFGSPDVDVDMDTGSSEPYDERTVLPASSKPYLDIFSPESGVSRNVTESDVKMEDSAHSISAAGSLPQQAIGLHPKATAHKMVEAPALDHRDDVAVNTEPYKPFETNKGDMIKKEKDNVEFEKQMHKMKEDYKEEEQRRKEDISTLETELESLRVNTEITNKELELFQQKLEEEVKKDQLEKKENQETLKSLKSEIKELSESHETISKSVREKNKEYEKHLEDFLEDSNRWAAEKMSLEEKIQRYRDVCAEATRRSQAAEISILENRRRKGLRGLNKCVSDGETILARIKEMVASFPSSGFQSAAENWRAFLRDAREKLLHVETQYKEQMELVKKGTRLCTLPLVTVPTASPLPAMPAIPMVPINNPTVVHIYPPGPAHQLFGPRGAPLPMRHQLRGSSPGPPVLPEASLGKPGQQPDRGTQVSPPVPQASRPAGPPPFKGPRAGPLQHSNVFEKIIDRLSCMFPHYSRPTLTKFIQEVRSANGGYLNSLSFEEVINRVAQLILDHQDNAREQMSSVHRADPGVFGAQVSRTPPPRSDSPAAYRPSNTPPPSHVWKSVGSQNPKLGTSKALNLEDPCIICHEEMSRDDLCVLECRHSFHRECIKSWLKEQSTCPTCRDHALLPEDFPLLPGRIRRGPTPAAPSS
ncbi:E3 ubiquitin-protein ligase TTC3 isoform X2 [Conger conger]|uniref:E3 ubiquitin-protein ligase TTC3 isoform X2 n=1 Tax=Conger conger TaxID=82655 RepID=UPI002A59E06C|nr:E3 ubiquitin-protein ligase TTC3 isoform X2 [Conger conger]